MVCNGRERERERSKEGRVLRLVMVSRGREWQLGGWGLVDNAMGVIRMRGRL